MCNKLPDASSQALFADSQAHIWALEGLSHLVAASLSEDQLGVVQVTLPSILNCMLALQDAVDAHFKLPYYASRKPVRSFYSMGDPTYQTLRFTLRATLNTAIDRITSTFEEHLNAIQVSVEHQKRFQQIVKCKEGHLCTVTSKPLPPETPRMLYTVHRAHLT